MSDSLFGTIAQGVDPMRLAGQVMQYRTAQQQLANQQFALQQAKLQPAYSGLQALRMKPDANWDDINASLAGSARLGADISGLTDDVNAAMARGQSPGDFVRSYAIRGMSPEAQFEATTPPRGSMETAGGTYYGTFGAAGGAAPGAFQPAGFIGRGLSPEQRMQPTTIMVNGQPTNVTMGQLWDAMQSGGVPGTGGGGGPPQPTAPSPDKASFVQSFTPTAQRIAKATGLPVNYIVAQAGLETGWGTSSAYQGNNAFGISAPGQPGVPARYGTAAEGEQAYINLINSRYANVPRTGSLQDIGDAMARAGYNPAVPGAPGGSYGQRIAAFGAGVPYQVASTGAVPAPGAAPTPAPVPALPATPSLAPGGYPQLVQPGQAEVFKGAAGEAQGLLSTQAQTLATRAILAGMETDINTRGFVSGTGSASFGNLRQLLQSVGIAPQSIDIQQGQSAQEQFQKFSSQLQAQQMQALGAPSDARQEMSEASNPSMHLSAAGNLKIVHMLMGNQQAIDVMGRTFAASGESPANFYNWRQQFTARDRATGGEFDPRVFWLSNMSPQDQQEYVQTTRRANPKAWEQLSNNLQYAKNQGWISAQPDGSIGSEW